MKDLIYGTAAGAVGALVWAGIAYVTEYEVGYTAWAIGAFVGFSVAAGNREGLRSPTAAGAIAVVIAALSIIAGKIATVDLLMPSDEEVIAMITGSYDEEFVMSFLADDVADEYVDAGRPVDWPTGVDPSTASEAIDYPPDVWAEAVRRWSALSGAEQDAYADARLAETRANLEANMSVIRASMTQEGFFGSFSPMDLVFFGLAMVTAWGFGSGKRESAA